MLLFHGAKRGCNFNHIHRPLFVTDGLGPGAVEVAADYAGPRGEIIVLRLARPSMTLELGRGGPRQGEWDAVDDLYLPAGWQAGREFVILARLPRPRAAARAALAIPAAAWARHDDDYVLRALVASQSSRPRPKLRLSRWCAQ